MDIPEKNIEKRSDDMGILLERLDISLQKQKESPNYDIIKEIIPFLKENISIAKDNEFPEQDIQKLSYFLSENITLLKLSDIKKFEKSAEKLLLQIRKENNLQKVSDYILSLSEVLSNLRGEGVTKKSISRLEQIRAEYISIHKRLKIKQELELNKQRKEKLKKVVTEKELKKPQDTILKNKLRALNFLVDQEGKPILIKDIRTKALTQKDAMKKGLSKIGGDFELNKNGFISMVFLGKDGGGKRADSLMQFLIDPYTRDMAQISISRDILVKNSKGTKVKLNSLNGSELYNAIGEITGQDSQYLTSIDINKFSNFFQPIIDKHFTKGVKVDFGDTLYEINGKKYTGQVYFTDAQELLTVARARKGLKINGKMADGSDTGRRKRQEKIILSIVLNNPIQLVRAFPELSKIISNIEGESVSYVNTGKFIKDFFNGRQGRKVDTFSTKIEKNVSVPYGDSGKFYSAVQVKIEELRKNIDDFFSL